MWGLMTYLGLISIEEDDVEQCFIRGFSLRQVRT